MDKLGYLLAIHEEDLHFYVRKNVKLIIFMYVKMIFCEIQA